MSGDPHREQEEEGRKEATRRERGMDATRTDQALRLIGIGADASVSDDAMSTPLHFAAQSGHEGFATLIAEGADVAASNRLSGANPLHFAAGGGHVRVAKALLDAGADLASTTNCGCTALHSASVGGQAVMTKFLLEKGADVAATNGRGATALHHAAVWGSVEVARGLGPFRTPMRPSPWRAPLSLPCHLALLSRMLSTLNGDVAPPALARTPADNSALSPPHGLLQCFRAWGPSPAWR
jgi:ankyrin repeat protein